MKVPHGVLMRSRRGTSCQKAFAAWGRRSIHSRPLMVLLITNLPTLMTRFCVSGGPADARLLGRGCRHAACGAQHPGIPDSADRTRCVHLFSQNRGLAAAPALGVALTIAEDRHLEVSVFWPVRNPGRCSAYLPAPVRGGPNQADVESIDPLPRVAAGDGALPVVAAVGDGDPRPGSAAATLRQLLSDFGHFGPPVMPVSGARCA